MRTYDRWAADPFIKETVARYLGADAVRRYIKDTLARRLRSGSEPNEEEALAVVLRDLNDGFILHASGPGRQQALLRGAKGGLLLVTWGVPERWKDLLARLLEAADQIGERRDGDTPMMALLLHVGVSDSPSRVDSLRRIAERCGIRVIVREN